MCRKELWACKEKHVGIAARGNTVHGLIINVHPETSFAQEKRAPEVLKCQSSWSANVVLAPLISDKCHAAEEAPGSSLRSHRPLQSFLFFGSPSVE